MLFFCLAMWLGGGMLYVWIISLIFYRYTFFTLSPSDLAPPYWINMGAVAISTLAGTMLVAAAPRSPLLARAAAVREGLHAAVLGDGDLVDPDAGDPGRLASRLRRFPLRYDPLYWGAVFPLGMYTAATFRLAHALDVPLLQWVAPAFAIVALAAWLLAFAGLLRQLLSALRGRAAGRVQPATTAP